jgi:hypothetical protein
VKVARSIFFFWKSLASTVRALDDRNSLVFTNIYLFYWCAFRRRVLILPNYPCLTPNNFKKQSICCGQMMPQTDGTPCIFSSESNAVSLSHNKNQDGDEDEDDQ